MQYKLILSRLGSCSVTILAIAAMFSACASAQEELVGEIEITLDFSAAAENIELFATEKREFLPADKAISGTAAYYENDTVFEVLKRYCRDNEIALDFSSSVTGTYIKGINQIYEFDAGGESGWTYYVDGIFAEQACDKAEVGSEIYWYYVVNSDDKPDFIVTA